MSDYIYPVVLEGVTCTAAWPAVHDFQPLESKEEFVTGGCTVTGFYCRRCLVQVDKNGRIMHSPKTER